MRPGKTCWLCAALLTWGALWLSTALCSAQSPAPFSTPALTITATSPSQGQRPPQSIDSLSSGVVGNSPRNSSSSSLFVQPEPTPLPEFTLFTVLTPARCLILALVGAVVFIIVYGLQVAFLRRLR